MDIWIKRNSFYPGFAVIPEVIKGQGEDGHGMRRLEAPEGIPKLRGVLWIWSVRKNAENPMGQFCKSSRISVDFSARSW